MPTVNRRFIGSLLILYVLVIVVHIGVLRPQYLEWGATMIEQIIPLPGDNEIPTRSMVTTRAITIHAPAHEIWKWIVQIGQDRGGWYSFTWLENLFGAHMTNTNVIVDEWQSIAIGDKIPYLEGGAMSATISYIELDKALVFQGWTFYLVPIDEDSTRLVVRYPSFDVSGFNAIYYYPIFEPAHFIMEAGMMLGIKDRAER